MSARPLPHIAQSPHIAKKHTFMHFWSQQRFASLRMRFSESEHYDNFTAIRCEPTVKLNHFRRLRIRAYKETLIFFPSTSSELTRKLYVSEWRFCSARLFILLTRIDHRRPTGCLFSVKVTVFRNEIIFYKI